MEHRTRTRGNISIEPVCEDCHPLLEDLAGRNAAQRSGRPGVAVVVVVHHE